MSENEDGPNGHKEAKCGQYKGGACDYGRPSTGITGTTRASDDETEEEAEGVELVPATQDVLDSLQNFQTLSESYLRNRVAEASDKKPPGKKPPPVLQALPQVLPVPIPI